jgi:hypothetical protein
MTEQERPYKEYRDILETEYDITQLTVMQVDCFCNSMHKLEQQLLFDRDQFAIGFAEWVGNNEYKRMSDNRTTWWGREWLEHKTTLELLELFKEPLKTEQK